MVSFDIEKEPSSGRRKFMKGAGAIGVGTLVHLAGCNSDADADSDAQTETASPSQRPTPKSGDEDSYTRIRTLQVPYYNRNSSPLRNAAMNMIAEQAGRLGINFELQALDLGALLDIAYKPDNYDLIMVGGSASPARIDPVVYLGFHYFSESSGNYLGYENPDFDGAFKSLETSLPREERMEAAVECQNLLAADVPSLFPWHNHSLSAVNNSSFTNWQAVPGTWPYWAPDPLRKIESNGDSDTVIFGTTMKPVSLNPMAGAAENNQQAKKMIYSRLVHVTTEGDFEPRDAESIDVRDNTTIDVTLRSDVRFHDDEPLTAEDVQFTYDYLAEHGVPDLAGHYEPVDNVEVIDERTARFNLKNSVGSFTTISLSKVNILPKHIWENVTSEHNLSHPGEWANPDLTGSGPFEIVEFQPEESVHLSVNQNHWMDFSFNTLIWSTYGSQASVYGDLSNGNVTFTQKLTPTNYRSAENESQLKAVAEPSHSVTYLHFVLEKEPLNDLIFRRAFNHAVNKQQIVNEAAQGLAQVATDVVPPSSPWDSGDENRYNGGIDRAIELLQKAGYRWDEDGNLLKPNNRFEGDGPPVYASDL